MASGYPPEPPEYQCSDIDGGKDYVEDVRVFLQELLKIRHTHFHDFDKKIGAALELLDSIDSNYEDRREAFEQMREWGEHYEKELQESDDRLHKLSEEKETLEERIENMKGELQGAAHGN